MRIQKDLNFNWYFNQKYEELHIKKYKDVSNFKMIDIPHTNLELPFNYLSNDIFNIISTYKKEIYIEKSYQGRIINLVFEGVAHSSMIYLNDNFIQKHEGGYDEFTVNITDYVVYDENNFLTVVVDNQENKDIPPFGNIVDYLGYGGIYREVHLEILEPEHINNVFIKATDILNNKINFDIETSIKTGEINIKIYDNEIIKLEENFTITDNKNKFICQLNDKILWTLNNPHLYDVNVVFSVNEIVKDVYKTRFGFRNILFSNQGFFLNNELLKLRGLNRHQSYPYVGYAMPKRAQEKDADILKYDLGLNIVRTSHYMQSRHFLNRCDEIGLLVFEEIPGWQYIGDEQFKQNSLNNIKSMITRDYNHPSIVMWGVRINESNDDDAFYKQTNDLAHKLDDSRPTGGVRNFPNSNMFEDVYTFNDFIHSGNNAPLRNPTDVKKNVPYLVTEFNGHMFPTKKYDNEQHRIEHALRHYRVINEAMNYNQISGTIGWCMFDYNTHQEFGSGDKVCYHGVLDMYRLPKYASYIYSSQQSIKPVLEVLTTLNSGDYPMNILGNIYVATNVDYIKLYKNNEYIKTFYPENKSKLPHPLIIIDDLIGNQLEKNEGFSKKDSLRTKDLFKAVSKYGANLPLKYKIILLIIMRNNKMKLNDAINLYFKYMNGVNSYRFDGYKNNEIVKSVVKENVNKFTYKLEKDNNELFLGPTYDVTRVIISKVDQNNNILPYAFDPIEINVSGGIVLIGPDKITLIGGSIAFWVKTNGLINEGKIEIKISDQILTDTIKINRG